MIPRSDITAWRSIAPWQLNEQVEQDIALCRALVEIFSDPFLKERLAFRGGTALHKLYLSPQVRYSEDIDLVQTESGPIGKILDAIRETLSFLGNARSQQSQGNNSLIYRFESEIPPVVRLRLKIEINCREHFYVLGEREFPFEINSRWYKGQCNLQTYDLNELLGTKLRALYQRKKGRDLFDLWYASTHESFNARQMVHCFREYISLGNLSISKEQFQANLAAKIQEPEFREDTTGLIRTNIKYDIDEAYDWIVKNILEIL
jgi:predicted nucleotidyltransferase component of viral defense system